MELKQYSIPVIWMVSGIVKVNASSLEEARKKVLQDTVPTCADEQVYVEGSWDLDWDIDIELEDS